MPVTSSNCSEPIPATRSASANGISPGMIQIGIVGLGFMAPTHLRAWRQVGGARVAALCNPSGRHLDGDFTNVTGNVGSTEPVKLDMTGIKATRRFADLLSDPAIHAIDICAPTKAHAEL